MSSRSERPTRRAYSAPERFSRRPASLHIHMRCAIAAENGPGRGCLRIRHSPGILAFGG